MDVTTQGLPIVPTSGTGCCSMQACEFLPVLQWGIVQVFCVLLHRKVYRTVFCCMINFIVLYYCKIVFNIAGDILYHEISLCCITNCIVSYHKLYCIVLKILLCCITNCIVLYHKLYCIVL